MAPRPGNAKPSAPKVSTKLFVLDTNVLMHDPTSLFRFEEHDVYLPMITLEELDNNKKGMTEVARNARQASRFLDDIVSSQDSDIENGVPLKEFGTRQATGSLLLQIARLGILVAPGLVIQRIFDTLASADGASWRLWGLIALLVAVALARVAALLSAIFVELTGYFTSAGLLLFFRRWKWL